MWNGDLKFLDPEHGLLLCTLFYVSSLWKLSWMRQMSLGYGYANFNSHAQAGALTWIRLLQYQHLLKNFPLCTVKMRPFMYCPRTFFWDHMVCPVPNLTKITTYAYEQRCGSLTFWYGSRCWSLALTNGSGWGSGSPKSYGSYGSGTLVHLHHSSKIKSHKTVTKQ